MKTVELYDIDETRQIETSNSPLYCKTSDGNYYVKFMDMLCLINKMPWYRALVNEYIVGCIASLMELPVPDMALVKCHKEIMINVAGETLHIKPSVNFGSKAVDGAVLPLYTIEQLNQIENKNDLLSIIVFDSIVNNVDRDDNHGNTIVTSLKPNRLFIIDHGRVFGASEVWSKFTLKNDQEGKTIVRDFSIDGIYSLFSQCTDLKSQIDIARNKLKLVTKEKLEEIIYSTPKEWGLSSEDADALLEYLYNRFQKGEEYIKLILGEK